MEENKKNKLSLKLNIDKDWYKSTWFITICTLIIVITGYWIFNQINESKKVFTQYEAIKNDSINAEGLRTKNDSLNQSIIQNDTTAVKVINTKDGKINQTKDTNSIVEKESIFKVNTSYDKIVAEPLPLPLGERNPGSTGDLFEKLLLPEKASKDFEDSFNQYALEKIVTSKSILKVLSIAGKAILLDENTSENQTILEAITESENIQGILIADRKGRVIYATNRKYVNGSISNILPKIVLDSDKLFWYKEDNQTIASLPLFHTYGKIGLAILITL
jgi:hypothetical protein